MKTNWKDVSSWSRSDIIREPKTWELDSGQLKIVVTRHIAGDANTWFLRCHDLKIDLVTLKSNNPAEARAEALSVVRAKLQSYINSLPAS